MKQVNFNLSIVFLREGRLFIAYAPALDLSTSGKTFEQAKKRFEEAASLFFEELIQRGVLAESLQDLGWHKIGHNWKPPIIVSHIPGMVSVLAAMPV